jgi:hypothetical protein
MLGVLDSFAMQRTIETLVSMHSAVPVDPRLLSQHKREEEEWRVVARLIEENDRKHNGRRRRCQERALSFPSTSLPVLHVFPVEVLRKILITGFLTPKEAASFLFNTSTTFVDALGGRDCVWKELLRQQWPSIPPITFSSLERLFYQLSRSPLLRKYDHANDSPFEQQQQQQLFLTPPKLCLDKFALTVTLRNNGDQAVFSHCLSALEMQGLLETGRVELTTTTESASPSLATTYSAFVHAWDLTTTTNPRVCALNEPNAWIWNDEKHCWQWLTRFVQWTKRGQDLEDRIRRQQQLEDSSSFGGLKFQLSIYPRVVVLEIRKRHGRYPDGLFRHYPEVQQQHHGVGLWHLLDELAGWKELHQN